jgi:hypothetical protein
MAKPTKKAKVTKKGNKDAEVEIEEDTTAEYASLTADLEAVIGSGSLDKTVKFVGKNLPLNQAVTSLLDRHAKQLGYKISIKVKKDDKALLLPIVYEYVDEIEEEA